ncbi:M16 family metallopeptidase [Deinococcus peraridilitoris]|uniref:Putative Zn-dependent peptidase n=1 Tax=Deinococcus peraridilitoris (strain DSM 19664 / LMG 22246 / CIP 109416 / KR-200) TaxID=937777 RepID=L0A5I6_DEIPD|nr:pitrilysin family protein [Deinococcus peraridilitoris]AFZ68452.1 putative Zn-dependent peptidase [Deinococcus peraridilitoris DSM 19664]
MPWPDPGARPSPARGPQVLQIVLPNGLTVLGESDEHAETVALGYFVRTGARDETLQDLGASHFIEHLLFKGSERVSGRELNVRLDALGANVNAFTSEETTVYHAACLPETWPELLSLLTELMQPAFRPADVEIERGVILEEIAMYADDPSSRTFDELRAQAWGTHPLGHLVLGTPQTVAGLTLERLQDNFRSRYGTGSVTLVACGRFDWNALVTAALALTSAWPQGNFTRALSPHSFSAGLQIVEDTDMNRANIAFLAPGLQASHPLREAAVVLAEILGGDNGRLYWALVDGGLADSVDLSHVEFEETGAFEGAWSCDPTRAGQTLEVVRGELQRVQLESVTEAELARARKKLAVSVALRAETPYARLFTLGMDHTYLGRTPSVAESVAAFERVSRTEVEEVLALRPFDALNIVVLGPPAGQFPA